MLIVDGLSDRHTTVVDRETDWQDTPYAFVGIWNFGAIEAAGADLWSGTNEFGTIYQAGTFKATTTAAVRIVSQDNTGGWARSGLIVRNDLATNGAGGYLSLAITPANGCACPGTPTGQVTRAATRVSKV